MVRILAVEDGGFKSKFFWSKRKGKTFLVCVLVDDFKIEKIFLSYVTVDGLDATTCLSKIIRKIRDKLDVIMLASIAYAGFNLVDPEKILNQFKVPILIVNPKKPNDKAVEFALKKHFKDWMERLSIVRKAGKPSPLKVNEKIVYVYCFGLKVEEAEKLVKHLTVFGVRPEPLRVANLIAHGLGMVN